MGKRRRRWTCALASSVAILAAILIWSHVVTPAANPGGASGSAASASAWLAPGTLLAPAASVGPTGFTLAWTAPQVGWTIASYRVWCDGNEVSDGGQNPSAAESAMVAFRADPSNTGAQPTSTHHLSVTGLAPGTTHSITIAAQDDQGQSHPFGGTLTVTTAQLSAVTDVRADGAVADGHHDDTAAIQRAIDGASPGGTVLIPAGVTVVSGPFRLTSGLTLDVEGVLLASTAASDYAPGTASGQPLPLISAGSDTAPVSDIRIVGTGTIDGQGWKPVEEPTSPKSATPGTPTGAPEQDPASDDQFAKGNASTVSETGLLAASQNAYALGSLHLSPAAAYEWRSSLISVRNATRFYVGGGLNLVNPAMHVLTVNNSSDVTLDRVSIHSYDTNNGDGIDFAASQGLTVMDSFFDTGDDSVNLNAGYGRAGEKGRPVTKVWVFDSYFAHGHAALALGSGTAATISQVLAEDNVINGSASGLRLKSSAGNGGGAYDIVFRTSALKEITEEQGEPFVVTSSYPQSQPADVADATDGPLFHDVWISGCTIDTSSGPGIAIDGLPGAQPYGVHFADLRFTGAKAAQISDLRDSSFTDVTSDLGAAFFAHLENVSGLVFTGAGG